MSNRFRQKLTMGAFVAIASCLFFAAGINQAFAFQDPPQEYPAQQGVAQNRGWVTIEGTWKYYDRDGSSVPASRFYVQLIDANENMLGACQTDGNGHFYLQGSNPGGGLWVRIYTDYTYYDDYDEKISDIMVLVEEGSGWRDSYYYDKYVGSWTEGHHELDIPLKVPSDCDVWRNSRRAYSMGRRPTHLSPGQKSKNILAGNQWRTCNSLCMGWS